MKFHGASLEAPEGAAGAGIGSSETLRKWVRRANEILTSASAFFVAELDRPHRY
jgi:transposase-like protein